MNSQTIQIMDIGYVFFEYSKRAKHINISVKHPSNIRVAIPEGISIKKAKSFVISKEIWIKKNLLKLKLRTNITLSSNPIDLKNSKNYLLQRIADLANKYGFNYNKVTIKNQKTRWGSCSGYNNISLNVQLISLPSHLIDYVILHELVHTLIKNHSPLFWQSLDKYVGNARSLNKELKKYILS